METKPIERGMNKVIIVTRKTRLTELVEKYNTLEQAKFYIEHLGADFSDYTLEDKNYREAVQKVKHIAEKYARVQEVDRTFFPNMILGREDIVITVGQDGLVANVMKYLNGHPLIGINPDIKRWDGVLLPFEPEDLAKLLPVVIAGKYHTKAVTIARAVTKDYFYRAGCHRLVSIYFDGSGQNSESIWYRKSYSQETGGLVCRQLDLCGKRTLSKQVYPNRHCLW